MKQMVRDPDLPVCYGTGRDDECVLDCPYYEDCEPEKKVSTWDGEQCPFCGSQCIEMLGTTKGEDIGDQCADLERWTCYVCMEGWTSDQAEPAAPGRAGERP